MIDLPAPNPATLAARERIVAGLRAILPETGVIAEALRLKPYEADGLSAYRQVPLLPAGSEELGRLIEAYSAGGKMPVRTSSA